MEFANRTRALIANQENLPAQVRAVLETPGPLVCEVLCLPDEARIPSVASAQRADGSLFSKPIEDWRIFGLS
jgi:acetolactate synthase-1/2/3 large subunit